MATLNGSIEADVPIAFADREWMEFIWRSFCASSQESGFPEAASTITGTDADSGIVKFETAGERVVKVSVELQYTPRGVDAEADVARAQARLNADLVKYRTFLLRRCEQDSCRLAAAA